MSLTPRRDKTTNVEDSARSGLFENTPTGVQCPLSLMHFSPTSVQFKSQINGAGPCKRHQSQHLEFSTTFFGTRRSVVQIHSPRPSILESATYRNRYSR
jgi:hypothetical protein